MFVFYYFPVEDIVTDSCWLKYIGKESHHPMQGCWKADPEFEAEISLI